MRNLSERQVKQVRCDAEYCFDNSRYTGTYLFGKVDVPVQLARRIVNANYIFRHILVLG
jgi:hypothetical protein